MPGGRPRKRFCKRNHDLNNSDNVRERKQKYMTKSGPKYYVTRECLVCHNINRRERRNGKRTS